LGKIATGVEKVGIIKVDLSEELDFEMTLDAWGRV
jgi:hypothetical protein